MSTAIAATSPLAPSPPPRFSWPKRFLLAFLLFDIVGQSVLALVNYGPWMDEKGMGRFPRPLTSLKEWSELAHEDGPALSERIWDTCDSLWDYAKPWPNKAVREQFCSWSDWGMYGVAWLGSRLAMVNNVIGIRQHWTMFSPTVAKGIGLPRARLLYADDTSRVVRSVLDPEDLTHFWRWLNQRRCDSEKYLFDDELWRIGYYSFLRHQYPAADSGAPLAKILLYRVHYDFPAPDEDAAEVLRRQNGPPQWDAPGPFYVFEIAEDRERYLAPEERSALQKTLPPILDDPSAANSSNKLP